MRTARIVELGVVVGATALLVGCTTLGPMPATTGMAMVPAGRPSAEIGTGVVPGYYLSSGAQQSPRASGLAQLSLLLEPDRLLHLPGLVIGARHIGQSDDGGYFEPMVGYRVHLDDAQRFAAAGAGYLTHATGTRNGADYSATRGGAEVGFDVRVTPQTRWVELHANGSVALTGLSASGHYCLDERGLYGVDCPSPPTTLTAAHVSGLYPSGTAGISLDFAHHFGSFFHGGRLALGVSGGTMPTALSGTQSSAHWYGSGGLSLTLGFGARALAR